MKSATLNDSSQYDFQGDILNYVTYVTLVTS